MPFTLKLAPLLSVLRNRKMKKNKCQKKNLGRVEKGKKEARQNFQTSVF